MLSRPVCVPAASSLPPGPASSLPEWLAWQERLHGGRIMLGLERCRQVAARMGLLHPAHIVVSVAGTNGKGSSVHMLESVLRCAGYRVGAYTSPHLVRYNERVRLDGSVVDDGALCAAFAEVERARARVPLSYFEFGTLAALQLFREWRVDVALLEVGLGGRLDAVNVLDAELALITSIGLDHMHWLGRTRESIGREKAGIMRPGQAAVCADPEPPVSLLDHAESIGASLSVAGRDFTFRSQGDGWAFATDTQRLEGLPLPHPYSSCQLRNAAGVLMALQALSARLPLESGAIIRGLHDACPRGRFQFIPGTPPLILDVAHNLQAVEELCRSLQALPSGGRLHIVVGMLRDKEHAKVLGALAALAATWQLVDISGERGCSSGFLADVLGRLGQPRECVHRHADAGAALLQVRADCRPGDRVLVTGSFITVGEALSCLQKED